MLDPAFKLFGKTISLPSAIEDGATATADDNKGNQNREATTVNKEQSPSSEEKAEPITLSSDTDETNKEDDDQETTPEKESSNKENEQSPAESQEKPPLKKPGKIIPCPRCSSMDTKFCYYNNYNVNQPRHFCKKCQRYWTAGGTMRNVPVGAGRRKNKSSASPHCRHLTVSDAIPDQIHQYPPLINPNPNPNGTVLSFGSNGPLSVLNLADRTNIRNGFIHQEEQQHTEQQHSSAGSTVTASSSADEEPQRFAPPPPPPGITYMNGSPWPYQWSPIPFYPAAAAYWGCIPWLSPVPPPSPSSSPHSASLSICPPITPTLGKHPRDGDAPLSSSSSSSGGGEEKCLWFPKTLRIHDPEEAAKSSLWATMGLINNDDKSNPVSSRGGLFRPLQAKEEHIVSHKADQAASHLLYANPAALLRSINFHESL